MKITNCQPSQKSINLFLNKFRHDIVSQMAIVQLCDVTNGRLVK